MSPTQRTSRDRKIFIFSSNFIVRAVRVILPAAILLALALSASAAVTWNRPNTSGLGYWDVSSNWTPASVPGTSDDVTFGDTGTQAYSNPPTVTNEVRNSTTINTLAYVPLVNVQTTKIDSGILMRIQGTVAPPSNGDGAMSFWAATDTNSANSVSQSLFTGGGQMQIASSSGGNTGGDIVVRSTNGTAAPTTAILDLSGLSSFSANVDQLLVAYSNTGGSQDRPNAVMYLAVNNTLTLNNTGTIASAATANGGLILGFAGNHSSGQASTLYLGTTNTINMANAVLGGRRETVSMLFNPNMLSGGTQFTTTPTVTMRGIDGVSRVTFISLGDATGNVSGSTNMSSGTLDLSGGIADIKVTTLQMGTSTASSSSSSQGGSGVLTFTAGTVDATNVLLGNMVASLNTGRGGDTGTINANGTANLVVGTGGIILGSRNFTGQGTSTGTLNIRNSATVTINGNLAAGGYIVSATDGSYGNIMMRDSSTLDMQGHAIGAGGPINNFTVSGGSIVNTTAITAITFQVNGSSNSNYTLTTPLTIYNGGAINLQNGYNNTFTVSNLTLPTLSTSSLNFDLSNSTASGNDQISVGTLNLGSGSTTTVKVNPLSSTFATGTYHLLNYTSMSGSTTWNVSNPTRNTMSAPSINTTTKNLDLVVGYVPAHNLTWAGGTGSTSCVSGMGLEYNRQLDQPSPTAIRHRHPGHVLRPRQRDLCV